MELFHILQVGKFHLKLWLEEVHFQKLVGDVWRNSVNYIQLYIFFNC